MSAVESQGYFDTIGASIARAVPRPLFSGSFCSTGKRIVLPLLPPVLESLSYVPEQCQANPVAEGQFQETPTQFSAKAQVSHTNQQRRVGSIVPVAVVHDLVEVITYGSKMQCLALHLLQL